MSTYKELINQEEENPLDEGLKGASPKRKFKLYVSNIFI
jgi:hypothetical protein